MRVVYMDESGLSKREPILIEAALIVHGDDQVIPVEECLESLVEKHIPAHKREGFFFHATDIYGGGDKDSIFHDKTEWPDERRYAILDDLVAVPAKFGLPICIGPVTKAKVTADLLADEPRTPFEISVTLHALAIIQCEMGIEMWMRKNTTNEITHIIAENNNEVHQAARQAHTLLRDKAAWAQEGYINHACFPFKRIRDGLQFTTKVESRLLQVADAVAWAVRRAANKAPNAYRFYAPIRPQIVLLDDAQVAAVSAGPS